MYKQKSLSKKRKRRFPRIGVICSPWLGGSGIIATEAGGWLEKKGYYVRYITFDQPYRLVGRKIKLSKVDTLNYPLFPDPLYQLPLTEALIVAVKKYKLDILHCHYIIPFGTAAIDAKNVLEKQGYKIRVVLTVHGTDVLKLGTKVPEITRHVLMTADKVTAVSGSLAGLTRKTYKLSRKVVVIPNFVDIDRFKPKKRTNQQKVVVHMSNFRPVKRIDLLIDTFSKIHEIIPSKLVLIGEGPELGIAKELTKLNGLNPYVKNLGKVRNPVRVLQKSDLILTTSEYESFCLANLEAMSCGVPVASFKVGGIHEVVENNKSGMLVRFADTRNLAKKATFLLKEPVNKKFSMEARKRAEKFSIEKVLPSYERLFNSII